MLHAPSDAAATHHNIIQSPSHVLNPRVLACLASHDSTESLPALAQTNGNSLSLLGTSPGLASYEDPETAYHLQKNDWTVSSLSVVVLGASGDLAKKKIFPALFALYYEGLLPEVSWVAAGRQLSGGFRSSMWLHGLQCLVLLAG